ncbi:GDP-L-fucose synthase family protein [Maridesulfovibrio zosterae]|uniref:GDP-L-fucose synthase family protein n=1 Tax=Maridesulfovibrio zosterae TaxID=82171 RepID=UPI0004064585|nr:GDP-L-fucose synthase [Maridesulfovibrio zosterae]
MNKNIRIYVASADKAIGAATIKAFENAGYTGILRAEEPNLADQAAVNFFFAEEQPQWVVLAAGKSGGISYNRKYPADLIYNNLMVEANVINSAHESGVEKLLYLASSCSYPRLCKQPIKEEYLLTGPLEPTNQPYAVAKIAGIELCRAYRKQHGDNFIAAVPTNYFGPGDDFSPENSHVIGALIRRMHEAREISAPKVEIWGTGSPRREFIYSEDLGRACMFLLEKYESADLINISTGYSLSIGQLSEIIKKVVGYQGELTFDTSKPDGMPVKELDASLLTGMGWKAEIDFYDALRSTYDWFLDQEFKNKEI